MVTVMFSVLCAVMVVAAFAAGLLIGIRLYEKTKAPAPTYSAPVLTPEEQEMLDQKRKRKKEDDEAFAMMQGYNQSIVYQMSSSNRNEGM